jgi:phage/plasmid-like protein (TIGR03299 family)
MSTQEIGNKVLETLEQTGLNWTVKQLPLTTTTVNDAGESILLETPSAGIFRSDTNAWLGTTSKKYAPFQNYEMAETIVKASDGLGMDVTRGGELNGGKRVFLQTELKSEYIGKSDVKRYITALNSHNGTSSIGFGSSNTVVVCQNTFYKAYKDVNKFRHTPNAKERIEFAMQDLRKAIQLDEQLMQTFKIMSEQPIKEEVVSNVMKLCFDIDINRNRSDLKPRELKEEFLINQAISTEMQLEGATLWGLFNGVTRYTNHVANGKKDKEEYVMVGAGYNTNLTAYDTILAWVNQNTNELENLEPITA